ncbi:MAG TPA: PAS domain S-box protein [Casimicrobiaceae bacterium]|nr:PAS domain S-box protein [Casimicrobiaceae bacterium]
MDTRSRSPASAGAHEGLILAQERMVSIVDHVVDGIITIDDRGTIETFNPAAERIFGYASFEVIGRNVNVLMPEPYRGEHDGYLANYLDTGQAKIIGSGREMVGQRRDGSTFPLELAVSEFEIGPQRYFTGIVRDITERKRLEQELTRRIDDLAEADRQKNELLAMLAHELRNPLAPLRNALHLLKASPADPAVAALARDMMDRQLHHLVRLVDDLLDISRIIRGRIELRRERVDLAVAIARAIETANPVIEAYAHRLAVTLPAAPLYVDGDLVRLAQVIANLLTNAAKYTERAGRIEIVAAREHDMAVVRVRDTGIGIAATMQQRIFEVFVQGDASLARTQGGLGIGLTLVKRLVEMHGGDVAVTSDGVGKGSEFVVRLPAHPDAEATGPDVPGGEAGAVPSMRKRALVVDDNVDAAESIAMILRLSGCDVKTVHDGRSALAAAGDWRPDVILLDIGLPGMDGYEVARHVREDPRFAATRLVAVTGYGQEDDRRRALDAGFDLHLVKPVDPCMLLAFIGCRVPDADDPSMA